MSSKTASTPFHIPSLDGIRACAFLLVFLGHAGMPGIPAGFGVTVFFFLSGYLITTLLRMEQAKTGGIDFKAFYLRRALRILPPFYLVLVVSTLLTAFNVNPGELQLNPVLSQVLHYSNYWGAFRGFSGIATGTAVYWSLAVEEHFYAVFPALYVLLAKQGGREKRNAFLALCLVVLLWRCILVFFLHAPATRTFLSTETRVDSLLFGCALAVAGNPALDVSGSSVQSKRLPWTLFLAACLLLVSFTLRDEAFRESFRYTMQGVALYAFFYASVRFPNWGAFRLLNTSVLRFVGKLSYSLYLVHAVVLAILDVWLGRTLGLWPRGLLALALSLAIAWFIWLGIEKPAARLRKRLES